MVYYRGEHFDEQELPDEDAYLDYPNLRGIAAFDCNWSESLVDGGLDEVAAALAEIKGGVVVPYEVPDAELEAAATYYFVFRLRGVPWTVIHPHTNGPARPPAHLADGELADLSGRLGVRVIAVDVYEMAESFGYRFWAGGVLRESLESLEAEVTFESLDREADFDEDDGSRFAEDFLLSQDALFSGAGFRQAGTQGLKPVALDSEYEAARFVIGPPPANPAGS